jgi:hypothetical protein
MLDTTGRASDRAVSNQIRMGLPLLGPGSGRSKYGGIFCLPEVSLEMSGLFLEHLAASDPAAEPVVIWNQAGFHPKPKRHAVPERMHLVSLPPYSPELNPTEAVGDVIKDRIGNVLWQTLDDLEQAIGEELRPLGESAECVRRLVSHPWLVEQVNATATENSAITCSKWY